VSNLNRIIQGEYYGKFVVCYTKDGKKFKEQVKICKSRSSSTTRVFNEFFRLFKKRGLTKKEVKVNDIYRA